MSMAVAAFAEPGVWIYVNAASVETMAEATEFAAKLFDWICEQRFVAIDGGHPPRRDAFCGTFKCADAERIVAWIREQGVAIQ